MSAVIKSQEVGANLVEQVVVHGDLAKLSTQERLSYYKTICGSLGLNPLTKPLEYITLNGKLTLYARRDATDQLRKIHSVSITISSREKMDDLYLVTAQAKLPSGRTDESMGAVNLKGFIGDALANQILKCETKAKRRVTLSICGLGLLDETEVETIPGARITSNAGAGDEMTAKEKQVVADTAMQIKDKLAEGKEWDAYQLAVTIEENEAKLYLWTFLNSKERAAIKRMRTAEQKSEPNTGAPTPEEAFATAYDLLKSKDYDGARDLLPIMGPKDRKIIEDQLPAK